MEQQARSVWSGQLSATGRRQKQLLSLSLAQCGDAGLLGVLAFRNAPLICEGAIDGSGGARRMRLFASGIVRARPVWFAGVLQEGESGWAGGFVVTDRRGAITDEGKLKLPKVFFQEAATAPKPDDPCGKLVYESPIQVNDETAPDGTHKRIRFRIRRYELCVFVVILAPGGGDRVIDTIKLARDPGGVTLHGPGSKTVHVQGYSTTSKGKLVGRLDGGDAAFYGKLVVFVVDGCANLKLVQFVKQTEAIGSQTTRTDWQVDGGTTAAQPFRGTLPKGATADDGAGSMTDWPGRFEPPTLGLPFNTKVELDQAFETYVCCDGALIGYWSWTNKVSYTAKNGRRDGLQVDDGAPVWNRDPATGLNHAKVKC